MSLAAYSTLSLVHRALRLNHRYWFTTWRWGSFAAALLFIGIVLKIAMARCTDCVETAVPHAVQDGSVGGLRQLLAPSL